MKKLLIILFLTILTYNVLAAPVTKTSGVLDIGHSFEVNGKTLTIISSWKSGNVKVDVDGMAGIVKDINRTTMINDMLVQIKEFTYFDSETAQMIVEVTVNNKCGDNGCNNTETSESCCQDCGCEEGLKCINNICQADECVIDSDCDDNNPCTIDSCPSSDLKICSNINITECKNNDSCCPGICGQDNDTDCTAVIETNITESTENEENKTESTEEKKVEETKEESKPKVKEETVQEKKEEPEKQQKGINWIIIPIILGTSLLIVIIGYFLFLRKQ